MIEFSHKTVIDKKATQVCPCGYLGDTSGRCHCTSEQVAKYRAKISGPLLDRIDMHFEFPRIAHEVLRHGFPEGEENSNEVKKFCLLSDPGYKILEQAMDKFGISHRTYHYILKPARTTADLAQSDNIEIPHLSEAITYRKLDRTH